jgi:hypothetical protein
VTAAANNQLLGGYLYDSAGNMTRDNNGTNYVYDPENRVSSTTPFTYTYDADGNRVEKSNGSTTPATGTLYWYMTPGIVGESDLAGNLKSEYVFFDGERVARKDFPGNAVSYYKDLLFISQKGASFRSLGSTFDTSSSLCLHARNVSTLKP